MLTLCFSTTYKTFTLVYIDIHKGFYLFYKMGSYSSCLYILLFFTRNSYWNRFISYWNKFLLRYSYWYNSNIFLMATYRLNKNWRKTPIQSTICTILPYLILLSWFLQSPLILSSICKERTENPRSMNHVLLNCFSSRADGHTHTASRRPTWDQWRAFLGRLKKCSL